MFILLKISNFTSPMLKLYSFSNKNGPIAAEIQPDFSQVFSKMLTEDASLA